MNADWRMWLASAAYIAGLLGVMYALIWAAAKVLQRVERWALLKDAREAEREQERRR